MTLDMQRSEIVGAKKISIRHTVPEVDGEGNITDSRVQYQK